MTSHHFKVWDNLNNTNTPKSQIQDKGGKETDKGEENISKNAPSNKIAVGIRARNVPI